MKRQPIPQAEFSFTASAFNLAGQTTPAPTADAPKIMAEMNEAEREAVREASAKPEPFRFKRPVEWVDLEAMQTTPGLAPGSSWSVPDNAMRKALANH